jgi:hypothetical protein
MDLYPDAFVAAGLVRADNLIYRLFDWIFCRNLPGLIMALGPMQAKFLHGKFAKAVPHLVLPCGIHNAACSGPVPEWKKNDGRIYFSYAGNVGEAHDADFLVDFIECLDPSKHRMILAPYGAKANIVLSAVSDHPAVEVVKFVERRELGYLDVHVVSLLPAWTHLCVPSKAVSAVCSGSAVLFNGSTDSDTWTMLKDASWLVPAESTGRAARKRRIHDILARMTSESLAEKKKAALSLRKDLYEMEEHAYAAITEWIGRVSTVYATCTSPSRHPSSDSLELTGSRGRYYRKVTGLDSK